MDRRKEQNMEKMNKGLMDMMQKEQKQNKQRMEESRVAPISVFCPIIDL